MFRLFKHESRFEQGIYLATIFGSNLGFYLGWKI